jgi:sodium/bile acid cotransporter 7
LLAAVLLATTTVSRLFGFARADEITIVFCGSKKSLASGLPMASVRPGRPATDAVPSAPTHGLRRAGKAVWGRAGGAAPTGRSCCGGLPVKSGPFCGRH